MEEEMATHSSILAWRIPWTEEPVGLQSSGGWGRSKRVRNDLATKHHTLNPVIGKHLSIFGIT